MQESAQAEDSAPVPDGTGAHVGQTNSTVSPVQTQVMALPFPNHWDGYLQSRTQEIFKLGGGQPHFLDVSVRNATLYLETRIRELCDADEDLTGVKLMEYAFKPDPPRGPLVPDAMISSEAQGLQALFRGAVLQIRNPLGHREVNMTPPEAFDSIAFVSYLLRIANNLALERYVYPFLPARDKYRRVLLTKSVDIDDDGKDELVVLIAEQGWNQSSGPAGRVIVLRGDLSGAMASEVPLIPGASHTPYIAVGDLDGDGRPELVASFVMENRSAT